MEFYKASKKSTDDCSHPLTPQEELQVEVMYSFSSLPEVMLFSLIDWQILVTRNVSLVILLAASVLLGGVFFKHYEGWSYIASCYFTFVTVMSIGYGDLVVETWQSRWASLSQLFLNFDISWYIFWQGIFDIVHASDNQYCYSDYWLFRQDQNDAFNN